VLAHISGHACKYVEATLTWRMHAAGQQITTEYYINVRGRVDFFRTKPFEQLEMDRMTWDAYIVELLIALLPFIVIDNCES
jgi:hypothetical protein